MKCVLLSNWAGAAGPKVGIAMLPICIVLVCLIV